ncbi:MAG: hypothetical protein ACOZJX_13285 [Pseudomonadota bacterium]
MPNPYSPPEAHVTDQPRPPGSPWKAIGWGLLVDIGGTMVLGTVFAIVAGVVMAAQGYPVEEVEAAFSGPVFDSWVSAGAMLLGLGCSVAGGYVGARIVRRQELKFAAIQAVLANVLGLLLASGPDAADDRPFVLLAVSFVAVMAGAVWGQFRNRGQQGSFS